MEKEDTDTDVFVFNEEKFKNGKIPFPWIRDRIQNPKD